VVAGPSPYEVRLLTYYVLALALMTGEADRMHSLDPDRMGAIYNRYGIGRNPFNDPAYSRDPAVHRYWQHRAPDLLGGAFRRAVVEYYDAEREAAGRRSFAFFAEKLMPNEFLIDGVQTVFSNACPILLVRDPRDALCSYRGFWNGEPAECERLITNHLLLLQQMREQPNMLIVRYEDLVTDEPRALTRIWQHLGVPAVDPGAGVDPPSGHQSSTSVTDSVGRWRMELNDEEKARLNEVWKEQLRILDYPAD
jgi:hypothetical protein